MSDRRPTRIRVKVISFEKDCAELLVTRRNLQQIESYRLHAIIETPKGLFALNQDGVGLNTPITETNMHEVVLMGSRPSEIEAGSEEFVSPGIFMYTDNELRALPVVEEKPLNEFIRVSGLRLEKNYEQWRRFLEQLIPDEISA